MRHRTLGRAGLSVSEIGATSARTSRSASGTSAPTGSTSCSSTPGPAPGTATGGPSRYCGGCRPSVFDQEPAAELLPVAREANVGVVVRVVFHEGLLTGK